MLRAPFPDEWAHLQRYQDDFFSIYLCGAYIWDEKPKDWRRAIAAQARVWHLVKLRMQRMA